MPRLAVPLFLCLLVPAFKKSDGVYAAASAFLLRNHRAHANTCAWCEKHSFFKKRGVSGIVEQCKRRLHFSYLGAMGQKSGRLMPLIFRHIWTADSIFNNEPEFKKKQPIVSQYLKVASIGADFELCKRSKFLLSKSL
jgi:hypothetical protein